MKIEKTILVFFVIGLIFTLLHWKFSSELILYSLLAYSTLYLLFGFYIFCDKAIKRQNLALSIVSGVFLSIAPIGILFRLLHWNGGQLILTVGTTLCLITLGLVFYFKNKSNNHLIAYYKNMFIRTIILTSLSLLLFFTSSSTIVNLKYWDDKELARLINQYNQNPENEELKEKIETYIHNQKN